MKIIIKRKGKTNKPRKKSPSNNMANKKKPKSKSRSSSSGVFSGKVLGFEIPGVSKIIRNKTVQKAAAGAGLVSIAVSLAQLVNNPTINKAMAKKEVRIGIALAGGDVVGGAAQFVKEGGIKSLQGNGNGMTSSQVGFA